MTAEKASLDLSKMTPIHDRVLIKPCEEEKKTAGEVIAIGNEVKLSLAKGDMVIFQRYATAEVDVPEGNVLFVAEKSIMAKLIE
ncbi:MAG: hypothetical protein WDW36_004132 [Sanguina aurantia]